MSYNKHTWATGNVVSAVDLNRMEQGIEDAGSGQVLVINPVYNEIDNSYTLDKTWQEIYDAFPFVIEYYNGNETGAKIQIHSVGFENSVYLVEGVVSYTTSSASGYPTTSTNSGGGGSGGIK